MEVDQAGDYLLFADFVNALPMKLMSAVCVGWSRVSSLYVACFMAIYDAKTQTLKSHVPEKVNILKVDDACGGRAKRHKS